MVTGTARAVLKVEIGPFAVGITVVQVELRVRLTAFFRSDRRPALAGGASPGVPVPGGSLELQLKF